MFRFTVKVDLFELEYFQKLEVFVWWRHRVHPLSPQEPQQKNWQWWESYLIRNLNPREPSHHFHAPSWCHRAVKPASLTLLHPREPDRKRNGILNWVSRLPVPKVMQVKPARVIQIEICHSILWNERNMEIYVVIIEDEELWLSMEVLKWNSRQKKSSEPQ